MNALQDRYGADGFQMLAVPCNQFHRQEPAWTPKELMDGLYYIRPGSNFVPHFPLTWKVDVNGKNEDALYTYMKSVCPPVEDHYRSPMAYDPVFMEDVRWNYEKFLIGPDGRPLYRYSEWVEPADDVQMHRDIVTELHKLRASSGAGIAHNSLLG